MTNKCLLVLKGLRGLLKSPVRLVVLYLVSL